MLSASKSTLQMILFSLVIAISAKKSSITRLRKRYSNDENDENVLKNQPAFQANPVGLFCIMLPLMDLVLSVAKASTLHAKIMGKQDTKVVFASTPRRIGSAVATCRPTGIAR